jgi:GT2 family glycosyltransferase
VVALDVGVVTFNTRDLTISALERLLEHSDGMDVRLLVRDNASSDGTAEAIRERFPEAHLDAGDRNIGFAAGMNRLIETSDGAWFLALNSDAWPERGALRALLSAGEANPSAAAIAPRLERPDGSLEHSTFPFPSLGVASLNAVGGYTRLWPRLAKRLALVGAWDHDEPRDVDWAIGAALLMRRVALDALGGFDESFFMYVEDLEWCWRARQAGWTIRFEPEAVVRHVGNASGASAYGGLRTQAHVSNGYRFYRRVHGAAGTLAYRAVNVGGCGRQYLMARARRDEHARAQWAEHLKAHLHPHAVDVRP